MPMAAANKKDILTFTIPTIGPKVYVVKGPSNWPETFNRKAVDQELAEFVKPATINELVDLFITGRELSDNKEPTTWFTITGFLGRTMNCSPLMVPHAVGIAFWAHVVMATANKLN